MLINVYTRSGEYIVTRHRYDGHINLDHLDAIDKHLTRPGDRVSVGNVTYALKGELECAFCPSTDTAETIDYRVSPPKSTLVCYDHGRI